jgi:hypothetical protein
MRSDDEMYDNVGHELCMMFRKFQFTESPFLLSVPKKAFGIWMNEDDPHRMSIHRTAVFDLIHETGDKITK